MSALPLVFDAGGEAELVAETAHPGDIITTATHIIFHCKSSWISLSLSPRAAILNIRRFPLLFYPVINSFVII
ncbi:MAG: hypothetical protein WCW68_14890, partial [Methanothrix sp.]